MAASAKQEGRKGEVKAIPEALAKSFGVSAAAPAHSHGHRVD